MPQCDFHFLGRARAGHGLMRWLRPRHAAVRFDFDEDISGVKGVASMPGSLAFTFNGTIWTVGGGTFALDRGRGTISYSDSEAPHLVAFRGSIAPDLTSISGSIDLETSCGRGLHGRLRLRQEQTESPPAG